MTIIDTHNTRVSDADEEKSNQGSLTDEARNSFKSSSLIQENNEQRNNTDDVENESEAKHLGTFKRVAAAVCSVGIAIGVALILWFTDINDSEISLFIYGVAMMAIVTINVFCCLPEATRHALFRGRGNGVNHGGWGGENSGGGDFGGGGGDGGGGGGGGGDCGGGGV